MRGSIARYLVRASRVKCAALPYHRAWRLVGRPIANATARPETDYALPTPPRLRAQRTAHEGSRTPSPHHRSRHESRGSEKTKTALAPSTARCNGAQQRAPALQPIDWRDGGRRAGVNPRGRELESAGVAASGGRNPFLVGRWRLQSGARVAATPGDASARDFDSRCPTKISLDASDLEDSRPRVGRPLIRHHR